MPERKYASHSANYCTGVRTKRSIKYGMGGPIGSRTHAGQQHKNSENKWKKQLKAPKKQNKMLYSIGIPIIHQTEVVADINTDDLLAVRR